MTKCVLQQRLQAALSLPDDSFHVHATDLYIFDSPGVREWLNANYEWAHQVSYFRGADGSPWAGKGCPDIPFAAM